MNSCISWFAADNSSCLWLVWFDDTHWFSPGGGLPWYLVCCWACRWQHLCAASELQAPHPGRDCLLKSRWRHARALQGSADSSCWMHHAAWTRTLTADPPVLDRSCSLFGRWAVVQAPAESQSAPQRQRCIGSVNTSTNYVIWMNGTTASRFGAHTPNSCVRSPGKWTVCADCQWRR